MSDLIDREALLRQIDIDSEGESGYYGDTWKFIDTIKSMPSAQPEIIRCKDCKKSEYHRCTRANHYVSEYDHCMSIFGAERRTE